jgi:hypothetical protein
MKTLIDACQGSRDGLVPGNVSVSFEKGPPFGDESVLLPHTSIAYLCMHVDESTFTRDATDMMCTLLPDDEQ